MTDPNPFTPRYALLASLCGLVTLGGCSQDYTTSIGEAVGTCQPVMDSHFKDNISFT